jgi:hypothetical protein
MIIRLIIYMPDIRQVISTVLFMAPQSFMEPAYITIRGSAGIIIPVPGPGFGDVQPWYGWGFGLDYGFDWFNEGFDSAGGAGMAAGGGHLFIIRHTGIITDIAIVPVFTEET